MSAPSVGARRRPRWVHPSPVGPSLAHVPVLHRPSNCAQLVIKAPANVKLKSIGTLDPKW